MLAANFYYVFFLYLINFILKFLFFFKLKRFEGVEGVCWPGQYFSGRRWLGGCESETPSRSNHWICPIDFQPWWSVRLHQIFGQVQTCLEGAENWPAVTIKTSNLKFNNSYLYVLINGICNHYGKLQISPLIVLYKNIFLIYYRKTPKDSWNGWTVWNLPKVRWKWHPWDKQRLSIP